MDPPPTVIRVFFSRKSRQLSASFFAAGSTVELILDSFRSLDGIHGKGLRIKYQPGRLEIFSGSVPVGDYFLILPKRTSITSMFLIFFFCAYPL